MSATIKYQGVEAILDDKWTSSDSELANILNDATEKGLGRNLRPFAYEPDALNTIARNMVAYLGQGSEIVSLDDTDDDDDGLDENGKQRVY